jgi:hypothetical protein
MQEARQFAIEPDSQIELVVSKAVHFRGREEDKGGSSRWEVCNAATTFESHPRKTPLKVLLMIVAV